MRTFLPLLLLLTLTACQSSRSDDAMMDDTITTTPAVTAEGTLDAVQDAGGLLDLAPSTAVANIDAWIDRLGGGAATAEVESGLRLLRAELTEPTLDGGDIGRILVDLGRDTSAAAGTDADLLALGNALTDAGNTLLAM